MKTLHKSIRNLNNNHSFITLLTIISIVIPLLIALKAVLGGDFPFWYDNARDLLSAWDNLSKLTLIGSTSGISGIFYGPYWIWLLSFGLSFSKDPRIVTLITATIPYFIIFPLIWFKFSQFFGVRATIIGWLFFIFSSGMIYATQLWNPYPASLIALIIIFLLLINDFRRITRKTLLLTLLTGFLLGLLINFHISFGIGFALGVFLFLIRYSFKNITIFFLIGIGLFVAFIPFLIFEFRHGFNQIHVILETFSKYGAVVDIKGLTKIQILQEFILTFSKLIHMPMIISTVLLVISLGYLAFLVKVKKLRLKESDTKILMLITSLFIGIGFIYLTAKNPVWAYHFIGVDILFLVLLTFFLAKISIMRHTGAFLVTFLIVTNVYNYLTIFSQHQSMFNQQKNIVQTISRDAQNSSYTVISYSSSIYLYEYSYLFQWMVGKYVPFDPSQNTPSPNIYLIVPKEKSAKIIDFIHYRSPDSKYKTAKKWNMAGDSEVIKRITKK